MIDAKHVHKLLECKYDFKHWIKDVISSFNFYREWFNLSDCDLNDIIDKYKFKLCDMA